MAHFEGESDPKNSSLVPYAGRWIALIRGRVIAQGSSGPM